MLHCAASTLTDGGSGTGVQQNPVVHEPLVQSAPTRHLPWTHFAQLPPQSVSVSEPFWTVSEHDGTWQTPPAQLLLVQSLLVLHASPSAHAGQVEPQSVSVSGPFLTPSVQDGP
jgi:hypothetical protein